MNKYFLLSSFNIKKNIGLVLVVASVLILIFYSLQLKVNSYHESNYRDLSDKMNSQLEKLIAQKKKNILALTLVLAQNKDIINFLTFPAQAETTKPKTKLLSDLLGKHTKYKNVWIHIIDRHGVSRHRSWAKKRGDSLIKSRLDVKDIINKPRIIETISTGIFSMTFKSMVPIIINDEFIGVVELITSFDSIFNELEDSNIKSMLLVDKSYRSQLTKAMSKTFIDDYYVVNLNQTEEILSFFKQQNISDIINLKQYQLSQRYFITMLPIYALNKKEMGYYFQLKPLNDIDNQNLNRFIQNLILFTLVFSVLLSIFAYTLFINKQKSEQQKRFFHTLIDSSNDAIIVTDFTHIIDNNLKFLTLFSDKDSHFILTKESVETKTFAFITDYIVLDSTVTKDEVYWQSHFLKQLDMDFELPFNIHGLSYIFSIHVSKLDVEKHLYAIRFFNITEQKATEEKLAQATLREKQSNEAKSEFLANMSHEIRTPMNGVLGMLELVLETRLDKEQYQRLSIAQTSANSLLLIINDILDFSKIESGKLEIESIDFNLREMLADLAISLTSQAEVKSNSITLDVKNIEHSMIKSDPGRLRQIITNIVGNAIKFTQDGDIIITASLEETDDAKTLLHCQIVDTGIGMSEEVLEHIFDSFQQEDASTTRKYGGTGLGLTIAKNICELMQGSISVTSAKGQGSCFKFILLVEKSEESLPVRPDTDSCNINTLLVSNNDAYSQVLKQQLEHWGVKVSKAEDVDSTLKLCEEQYQKIEKEEFFQLALIDIENFDHKGLELVHLLQENPNYKKMKMVILRSLSNHIDRATFSQHDLSLCLPKPVSTSNLLKSLSLASNQNNQLCLEEQTKEEEEQSSVVNQRNVNQDSPNNLRVLLVEDNHINQMVVKAMFKNLNFTYNVAANGLEALEQLKQSIDVEPFQLVFMDCQMPEMDGYEATRQIRLGKADKLNENITIIALTANAMNGDDEKCIKAGMNDYLSKPISKEKIRLMINKWFPNSLR